jgi:hypothetical protein
MTHSPQNLSTCFSSASFRVSNLFRVWFVLECPPMNKTHYANDTRVKWKTTHGAQMLRANTIGWEQLTFVGKP